MKSTTFVIALTLLSLGLYPLRAAAGETYQLQIEEIESSRIIFHRLGCKAKQPTLYFFYEDVDCYSIAFNGVIGVTPDNQRIQLGTILFSPAYFEFDTTKRAETYLSLAFRKQLPPECEVRVSRLLYDGTLNVLKDGTEFRRGRMEFRISNLGRPYPFFLRGELGALAPRIKFRD